MASNPTHFSMYDEPFWESANEGQLRMQCCTECSTYRYPPGACCPKCLSLEAEWKPVSGKGRVLSTPRLTTQNNVQAKVQQGIQIPIQTVANNTVTVTFKEAVLMLQVTPQITAAGTVITRVTVTNMAADFSRQVNGIPPIDTQEAHTQVQVEDGATTVIGGIFVSREQASTDNTPLLHRIPLLGWLFKRESVQDESRELLIFITPRILKS